MTSAFGFCLQPMMEEEPIQRGKTGSWAVCLFKCLVGVESTLGRDRTEKMSKRFRCHVINCLENYLRQISMSEQYPIKMKQSRRSKEEVAAAKKAREEARQAKRAEVEARKQQRLAKRQAKEADRAQKKAEKQQRKADREAEKVRKRTEREAKRERAWNEREAKRVARPKFKFLGVNPDGSQRLQPISQEPARPYPGPKPRKAKVSAPEPLPLVRTDSQSVAPVESDDEDVEVQEFSEEDIKASMVLSHRDFSQEMAEIWSELSSDVHTSPISLLPMLAPIRLG